MNKKYSTFLISFLAVFWLNFAPPTLAQSPVATQSAQTFVASASAKTVSSGIEVMPAFVQVDLTQPDQTQTVLLTYTNHTVFPTTLDMSATDFKGLDNGEFLIGGEQKDYSFSLTSYLSLESDSITLLPGEQKVFRVDVKNREDVSPGGHYAAILASFDPGSAKLSKSTSVIPALSSLILVRKTGGERYNLKLKDLSWPTWPIQFSTPDKILLTFENQGNIHMIPYGLVRITDSWGQIVYQGQINTIASIVMPETTRAVEVPLRQLGWEWPFSLNTFTLTGHDSLNQVQYQRTVRYLYINPIVSTLLIILLIVIGAQLFSGRRRHG